MSRPISIINEEIKACQSKISDTFKNITKSNTTELMSIRRAQQDELERLQTERNQIIRNIEVINPILVGVDRQDIVGI